MQVILLVIAKTPLTFYTSKKNETNELRKSVVYRKLQTRTQVKDKLTIHW
jgi:hypothetical protein